MAKKIFSVSNTTEDMLLRRAPSQQRSKKRVRFVPQYVNLVVPPMSKEPISALEKRSVWYTSKELQSKYQCDLDNFINYQAANKRRSKRTSLLLAARSAAGEAQHQERHSWSSSWTASCWRGLEHHLSGSNRTDKVRQVIQGVVALHHEHHSAEELRKASKELTFRDRLKAEQLGLQDAKDVGNYSSKKAVLDLLHPAGKNTILNSPTKQFKRFSNQIAAKATVIQLPFFC